jgi:hypothetical protein
MVVKVPKKVSANNSVVRADKLTHCTFSDLSDTEQEIILDCNVPIINLEAAEQPEAFYLTPDEDSDEADGAFLENYLTTQSPVKR